MLWYYDDGNEEYDDDDDESTLAISQVFSRLHISNRSGTRVMAWKLSKWKIIIETFQQNKISVVLVFFWEEDSIYDQIQNELLGK